MKVWLKILEQGFKDTHPITIDRIGPFFSDEDIEQGKGVLFPKLADLRVKRPESVFQLKTQIVVPQEGSEMHRIWPSSDDHGAWEKIIHRTPLVFLALVTLVIGSLQFGKFFMAGILGALALVVAILWIAMPVLPLDRRF